MGQSFHSVWVPIRITYGILGLIPIAGGWSLLQVALLWFGIMGAGLGNMGYQAVVSASDTFFKTTVLEAKAKGSLSRNFSFEVYKMNVCVEAHNAEIKMTGSNEPLWGKSRVYLGEPGSPRYTQYGSNMGSNKECGKIYYSESNNPGGNNYSGASSNFWGKATTESFGMKMLSQRAAVEAAADGAFESLNALMQAKAALFIGSGDGTGTTGVAALIANPANTTIVPVPLSPTELVDIQRTYDTTLRTAINGALTTSNALTDARRAMNDAATADGFTTAGAYYLTQAQASYAISALANNVGVNIAESALSPLPENEIYAKAFTLLNISNANKKGSNTSLEGGSGSGNQDAAWKLLVDRISSDGMNLGQFSIAHIITEGSGKPVIIRLKDMADYFVDISSVVITAAAGALGVFNDSLVGFAANVATAVASVATLGGWAVAKAAAVGAIKVWLELIIFIAQMSLGFFLMMSIYLPVIPFIIFMGQVLNWLITIVEGVAAAPFLAFAHLDTDGEGLGHKTQYGYIFALQSFMRPAMLVLGFVFGAMLLEAMGSWVMQIYPVVVANVQIDSVTGLFSAFGFTALFFVIMVGLVNTCFSVTYLLPDAIFQFIGAHSSATSQAGRHESENSKSSALAAASVSRTVQPRLDVPGARDRANSGNKKTSSGNEADGGETNKKVMKAGTGNN